MIDIQTIYETQMNTPVDYGQGPRSPISKKVKKQFLGFVPRHNGMGFIGRLPHDELFFASDHHFGHKNVIKYAGRPFADVEEMNEAMIERHNSVVGPNDYCVFGGDISFAPAKKANQHLTRMNGHKIFILGNHDFERDGSIKHYDVTEEWLWWPVYGIEEEFELVFSHYPLDGLPKNVMNLHGHIHEKLSPNPQHVNMCVEHHDYTPVRMDRVLEIARMHYEQLIG